MASAQSPSLTSCVFLWLFFLLPGAFCETCKGYTDSYGHSYSEISCPVFCCGSCTRRYCCSDALLKLNEYDQLIKCYLESSERSDLALMPSAQLFKSDDFDHWDTPGPSIAIAVGISIFVLFTVSIIICFTCSCCCLYKACRRQPRPVVTSTTATTVVQVPYPQQPGMMPPQGYPSGMYQGYNPIPVQPHGPPAASYPAQYPPPYPTQPAAPPAYHETVAVGAGMPAPQPPYNPAYMDPPKH